MSCPICGERASKCPHTVDEMKFATSMLEQNEVTGETSDGYHTFNELYDHRSLLFIALVINISLRSFWVREHYPGWDLIVVIYREKQLSYHIPLKYRDLYENIITEVHAEDYEFDGHTSDDVLHRLQAIIQLGAFDE